MKKKYFMVIAFASAMFIMFGCKGGADKADAQPGTEKSSMAAASQLSGTVTETMNTGGYTYVQIDTGTKKIWAAGPETKVKVGDKVVMPPGAAMNNYHSKTLNRDFDTVYFVAAIMKEGEMQTGAAPGMTPPGQPGVGSKISASKMEIKAGTIKKAKDGETVGDVYKNKQQLVGKKVAVRGKIVKFTPQIMGKNWLHIQDGTGAPGANDLTVTTAATVKQGDVALVTGVLAVDKDFGYGYKYGVILEDAEVKVE